MIPFIANNVKKQSVNIVKLFVATAGKLVVLLDVVPHLKGLTT